MSEQLDYPFDEVVDEAARLVMRGFTVFQKFTSNAASGSQLASRTRSTRLARVNSATHSPTSKRGAAIIF